MTLDNQVKLIGVFLDGKISQGTWKDPNGDIYRGALRFTIPNGYGIYTFKNGSIFEGNFEGGQWHGYGTDIKADGLKKISG